jgi:hypothetical protein
MKSKHDIIIETVEYYQKYDDATLSDIEYNLEQNIREFIGEIGIGETFSVNRLVSQMFRVSENIKNFGIPGYPLEEVYVYTDSRVEDSKVKQRLLGDYEPDFDERVVVEPSVATPFVFNRTFSRR